MNSNFPDQTIKESIFTAHHNYYQSVGIETIKQQAGQVEQVSSDYQGRVIYELLQNAFDKAESKIVVLVKDNCLYIANDGQQFSYRTNYDYVGTNTSERSDFQSLCSISTSTKDANKSIGNKGVGFKSVFAIAASGFVDIHTQGKILPEGASSVSYPISFRVYDSFKNSSELPEQLSEKVKSKLSDQIERLQMERQERGVPGYYYPVILNENDTFINELFDQGFVTVVKIPFAESRAEEIQERFKEIKRTHFQFIQIRIKKRISIAFEFEGVTEYCFTRKIGADQGPNPIVRCSLNDNIKELAKQAGITITDPQIALYLKGLEEGESTKGYLYNYLPTKVESPFRFVDFHADFHTTVDRMSINFEGRIGDYNKALLKACLELYFSYISSYLDNEEDLRLNADEYVIYDHECHKPLEKFSWKYLAIQHTPYFNLVRYNVRGILSIGNHNYWIASKFIAGIAKRYFTNFQSLSIYNYDDFYNETLYFINTFSRFHGESTEWPILFRKQLAQELKKLDANIIPPQSGAPCSINDEIIYREERSEDKHVIIPSFIGINFTSYKIEDNEFRKALDVKEFRDRNEILKHYRQVSPAGKHQAPGNQLTVHEQKILLTSISTLMGKTDDLVTTTHRYKNYIKRSGDNSIANLADFSISTVFLRTKTGKYKPAQLCSFLELDLTFLPTMPAGIKQETFLKYLGVSYVNNYRFVESPIWEALNEGLDYIPALWQGLKDEDDKLFHTRILDGIRVIANGKPIHPALINDFSFLEKLRTLEFKDETKQLLIKKLGEFPKEYLLTLIGVCKKNLHRTKEILKLYQKLFHPLHHHLKEYLVTQNGTLQFVKDTDFLIIRNEYEFDLIESLPSLGKPVLCYYASSIDSKDFNFKGGLLDLNEQEIQFTARTDKTEEINRDLINKIFYVLLEITNSRLSDVDYFEDPDKITELSKKIASYRFYEVEELHRKINIGSIKTIAIDRFYDFNDTELFIQKDVPESIKVEAISKCLFNNIRISKGLELILNHKDINTLKEEYKKQRNLYEQIFNRYWIADYELKFTAFSKLILEHFNGIQYSADKAWFEYTKTHKSEFILDVFKAGDLEELVSRVNTEKEIFENGLFSDLQLIVDLGMHDEQLARLGIILNNLENDIRVDEFKGRLNELAGKIGIDAEIEILEQEIKAVFPDAFSLSIHQDQIVSKAKEIFIQSRVERIYQNINKAPVKGISEFEASTSSVSSQIPVKTKKVIFQGSSLPASQCELIGSNGEEEVLYFLIKHFLDTKDPEKRKKALEDVHSLILNSINNSPVNVAKHTELFNKCIEYIDNDVELTKALIPFYYVTLHYKFAFIDLIAWYENKAVMVEVKTTQNFRNNSFRISNSEINEARANQNYMIVRVTPQEMILMGNPIYNIKEKLMKIEGGNYVIQPHGYTFEFIKQNSKIDA